MQFAAAAAAQTIYRETDAAGRVSFRDTPRPAAETADVPLGAQMEMEQEEAGRSPGAKRRISAQRNAQIDAEEATRRRRQDLRREIRKQALGGSLPAWER